MKTAYALFVLGMLSQPSMSVHGARLGVRSTTLASSLT